MKLFLLRLAVLVMFSFYGCAPAHAATVWGSSKDIGNSALNTPFQFVPKSNPQVIGPDFNLGVSKTITPTNGVFYTNLVQGAYTVRVGPYQFDILVPTNEAGTYNITNLWTSGVTVLGSTNYSQFAKVAYRSNDPVPNFLTNKLIFRTNLTVTVSSNGTSGVIATIDSTGGQSVAAGSNISMVTNGNVVTISASITGGSVSGSDVTNIYSALTIVSNLANLVQVNYASNFLFTNLTAAKISVVGGGGTNNSFTNPIVKGTGLTWPDGSVQASSPRYRDADGTALNSATPTFAGQTAFTDDGYFVRAASTTVGDWTGNMVFGAPLIYFRSLSRGAATDGQITANKIDARSTGTEHLFSSGAGADNVMKLQNTNATLFSAMAFLYAEDNLGSSSGNAAIGLANTTNNTYPYSRAFYFASNPSVANESNAPPDLIFSQEQKLSTVFGKIAHIRWLSTLSNTVTRPISFFKFDATNSWGGVGGEFMTLDTVNGFVGLGNTAPTNQLDVMSAADFRSDLFVFGTPYFKGGSPAAGKVLMSDASGGGTWQRENIVLVSSNNFAIDTNTAPVRLMVNTNSASIPDVAALIMASNLVSRPMLAGSNYVRSVTFTETNNTGSAGIDAAGNLVIFPNTNFLNAAGVAAQLILSNFISSARLAGSNYVRSVTFLETNNTGRAGIDSAGNLTVIVNTNFSGSGGSGTVLGSGVANNLAYWLNSTTITNTTSVIRTSSGMIIFTNSAADTNLVLQGTGDSDYPLVIAAKYGTAYFNDNARAVIPALTLVNGSSYIQDGSFSWFLGDGANANHWTFGKDMNIRMTDNAQFNNGVFRSGIDWGTNSVLFPGAGGGFVRITSGTNGAGGNLLVSSLAATNGISSFASNTIAPTTFTFPANNVKWTNTTGIKIEVYIDNTGVTATAIKKNNGQIFTTGNATFGLQAGEYFAETYSVGTPVGTWSPF